MVGLTVLFVLETNDGSLHLFSSTTEAELHLELIDIENGEYEFCDEVGQRFAGEVITPLTAFRAGSFRLRPDGVPDRTVVSSLLARARSLERECNGITTLANLKSSHDG